MHELTRILEVLAEPACEGVLATLVRVEGSSYRRPGARLLWRPGLPRIGTISGGCLEVDIIAQCEEVYRVGRARTIVYDTSREEDVLWGVGLGCHGTVHVTLERVGPERHPLTAITAAWLAHLSAVSVIQFTTNDDTTRTVGAGTDDSLKGHAFASSIERAFRERRNLNEGSPDQRALFLEYHPLPISMLIAGAGDDARPLCTMAAMQGWRVTVADFRPGYATRERFPDAAVCLEGKPEVLLADSRLLQHQFAVVMTHHYLHDLPWLRTLAPMDLDYLGLLGPQSRAKRIEDDLAKEGFVLSQRTKSILHAPVGLDIGGDGAQAVALSIMAEMQAVQSHRDGRSLRERRKPIHADIP